MEIMMHRNKLIAASALLVLVTIVLSLPSVHIPDGPDKVVHALVSFLYTLLIYEIYKARKGEPTGWIPLAVIIFSLALVGALYEVFQKLFIPTRTGDPADWLADVAGMVPASVFYVLARRKR
jgi:VanZ family protein